MDNDSIIIIYLASIFCFYLAGIKFSTKYQDLSQAFYLLASAQFLYGFTFINEMLSLHYFRDSEYFSIDDPYVKLISFLIILMLALITKNFIFECGALILYYLAITAFSFAKPFNITLIFINIILISSSGIFDKITVKIAEYLSYLALIITTIFIASNIAHHGEYASQQAFLAGKIPIAIMIVNFFGLILIISKNKNYSEKKLLLCLLALMPIFYIPHVMTMIICFNIISFLLTIFMIMRGKLHADTIFLILFSLMIFIVGIAGQGRGGVGTRLDAQGAGFWSFIFLIIVAYCAQYYRKKALKNLYKNDDQKA
jgi:hypothetical protein